MNAIVSASASSATAACSVNARTSGPAGVLPSTSLSPRSVAIPTIPSVSVRATDATPARPVRKGPAERPTNDRPATYSKLMRRLAPAALAAVALAGCGTTTRYITQVNTTTITTTTTRAVARTRRLSSLPPVTRPQTTTVTTTPAAASGGGSTYSGNGIQNVGTITVSYQATLSWRCSGCSTFAVISNPSGSNVISLDSTGSIGTDAVSPGTYSNVQVISNGNWAFVIR